MFSRVSGTPFCVAMLLIVPVGPPSGLGPLSPTINTTSVFSLMPISSMLARNRPT
jgi:hypothetical protein